MYTSFSHIQRLTPQCLEDNQTWLADGAKHQNLPLSGDSLPKTGRTCRCKDPTTVGCVLLPAFASSPSRWFWADPIPSERTWILIRLPPWRDIPTGLQQGMPKSGLWLAMEARRSGSAPDGYSPACQTEALLGGATWKEVYVIKPKYRIECSQLTLDSALLANLRGVPLWENQIAPFWSTEVEKWLLTWWTILKSSLPWALYLLCSQGKVGHSGQH